jgi:iron(III) transport system substrate-binding protein
MNRRKLLLLGTAAGLSLPAVIRSAAAQAVPAGYPAGYADLIAAAKKEGTVSIYSTTDGAEVTALLSGFRAAFPGVNVEYADQNSTELYNRFISEAAAGGGTADLLWSSAMDLQVKLVNDGYALEYVSAENALLPAWANWKNQAYGTTAEPVAFVYNTRLVPEADVPRTHAALAKLLTDKTATYKGKVTSYDPERSGVGFLFIAQDAQIDNDALWKLAKAIGKAEAKLYTSSGAMMERIASGEHLIGFNMIGSYAAERRKKDPTYGVVLPTDFTLVMSRIAFIPKAAKHPAAAKLFLDYLLSRAGQAAMAERSIAPIRTDMAEVSAKLFSDAQPAALKPIKVGPELLTYLEQTKRLKFLRDWKNAMKGS